ncbi:hypothetical protein Cgig2_016121 [Carnegiea gigantea]|uniref:Uncharacterized protein n=1 Tax=Carnegiea gigantea TaxID=171969 RepID=A0A9Q1KQ47_9CARY|nr:hypothetical protein Cgig2_016121 [Carnegiea gigantea]
MPLEGPFPEYVEFANEHDILIRQEEHTTPPTAPRLDTQAKHVENIESVEYAPVIKCTLNPKRNWNVRGLNWPNKQEDVKAFLYSNQISLIGLLETKVKKEKKAIPPIHGPASKQLELFLSNLRPRLNQLNKNSYADLHEQKAKAKNTLEAIQQQMIED